MPLTAKQIAAIRALVARRFPDGGAAQLVARGAEGAQVVVVDGREVGTVRMAADGAITLALRGAVASRRRPARHDAGSAPPRRRSRGGASGA